MILHLDDNLLKEKSDQKFTELLKGLGIYSAIASAGAVMAYTYNIAMALALVGKG